NHWLRLLKASEILASGRQNISGQERYSAPRLRGLPAPRHYCERPVTNGTEPIRWPVIGRITVKLHNVQGFGVSGIRSLCGCQVWQKRRVRYRASAVLRSRDPNNPSGKSTS